MVASPAYDVRLAKAAVRSLRALEPSDRERIATALKKEAARAANPSGSRGGKTVKQIRGRRDRFYRLRVGGLRVIFDVLNDERTLLVHDVVDRRDLERWLRSR